MTFISATGSWVFVWGLHPVLLEFDSFATIQMGYFLPDAAPINGSGEVKQIGQCYRTNPFNHRQLDFTPANTTMQ